MTTTAPAPTRLERFAATYQKLPVPGNQIGSVVMDDSAATASLLPDQIDELWAGRSELTPADTAARKVITAAVDLIDAGDPVEQARVYDEAGADELTFLDIAASHENRDTLFDVVARTAEQCFMPLTVGGGVREIADIRNLLNAGADKVSINTAAVHRPEFVREAAERFASGR